MKPAPGMLLLLLGAGVAGWLAGNELCGVPACRDIFGRGWGRGRLVALVNGTGFYDSDLEAAGLDDPRDLVIAENLRQVSASQVISADEIDREYNLLRFQFDGEEACKEALLASSLETPELRRRLAEELRARAWLEQQIAPTLNVSDDECRRFFEAHRELFTLPARRRARHLFLAAHAATPPEVVQAKRDAIAAVSARLRKGEDFTQIAADVSEDEATKASGGDLGWFSSARMPEEFVRGLEQLRVGQISAPLRSHLGFHVMQVTAALPPRELTFEEVRAEIANVLANSQRSATVADLAARLSAAKFLRSPE